ncbi:unnamed protein product [Pedinophyceae sp. YPF-701]|nr:unnamed protein product [Pedinophyceae sp. YPF-701]
MANTAAEIKSTLNDAIRDVAKASAPAFAAEGNVRVVGDDDERAMLPGAITVGTLQVDIPMTDKTLVALDDIGEAAPHGRGMETVVDPKVRRATKIDASHVSEARRRRPQGQQRAREQGIQLGSLPWGR